MIAMPPNGIQVRDVKLEKTELVMKRGGNTLRLGTAADHTFYRLVQMAFATHGVHSQTIFQVQNRNDAHGFTSQRFRS